MTATPKVTIVVFLGRQRRRAEQCLASLLRQPRLEEAEILLYETGAEPQPRLPGADHPSVRTLASPPALSFGEARVRAVHEAAAPIVAFLEEHVQVPADWLETVLRAHTASPAAAIGGVVHCLNPDEGVSPAVYLMNYARYLPDTPVREDLDMLEGHNCTYKRATLLTYGDQLSLLMLNEPMLHWRLRRDGLGLRLDPSIHIHHRNEVRLRDICRGYFLWNLNFGYSRPLVQGWPTWRRWLYVAAAPAIALVRFARLARIALQVRDRGFGSVLLRFWPAILIALGATVGGQTWGLLFGNRRAESAFMDYEVNAYRGVIPA